MCRKNQRAMHCVLGVVAVMGIVAMSYQSAEAANPFRFLGQLFESTAKHSDDVAKHMDDILKKPGAATNGVVPGTIRATRAATRASQYENRHDDESDGYGDRVLGGVAGVTCLLVAAYLWLTSKPVSCRKVSQGSSSP